jgi:hypothetical protein
MTQPLERRYRRLLRSYPLAYRQERAEEMISTLLELARPGQRRPTFREAAALALGGLRTRAVLVLLADGAAILVAQSIRVIVGLTGDPRPSMTIELGNLLTAALLCGALPLAAAGRRTIALPLILLAVLSQHWAAEYAVTTDRLPLLSDVLWQLPLAAALTIPLLRRRAPRSPHPARWLIAIPVALIIMPTQLPEIFPRQSWISALYDVQLPVLVAVLVGSLLWSVIDARVPLAAGALLLSFALGALVTWAIFAGEDIFPRYLLALQALISVAVAAVPLAVGALCAARRSRL